MVESEIVEEPSASESAILRHLRINRRVGRCRIRIHKGRFWEIELPANGGKRRRYYRSSPTAAWRLAHRLTKEANEHGKLARELTTVQRYEAVRAFSALEKVGANLLDVVADFIKRHPLGGNARTIDDVRVELVARKKKLGRSERHVKGLDYKLRCLGTALGNKPLTAITTRDLEDELETHPDWKPTTVHSTTQGWKVLFNFAIRCGYLTENPAEKLELPQIVREEPRILTLDQAKRLMAATLFRDRDPLLPECRAYLAIGMFAGVRPEEMVQLDWAQVDLGTASITIQARHAKCRARRIVTMEPNLVAWLTPIAKKRGPVLERSISELRSSARAVLGFPEWPHDVLRHSFASYHFAHFKSEALTKHLMGHSDDGRLLMHHYRVLVHPNEAMRFWNIIPPVALLA